MLEKRYDEAEGAYQKLIKLAPGVAEIHANLGLVYFQDGKYEQAIPALREALKLKPGLANAGYFLAMSLSETGQYRDALPGLEKGFKQARDPGLKRLLGLHLERAYTDLQRDNEAVEVALELTRLYPNDPEVLYQAGRLCGNFAYLAMQHLAQVAPDSVWRLQASAELFETEGHYDLAIAEYRQILTREPRRPGIHYRLGRSLLSQSLQAKTPAEVTQGRQNALGEFEKELGLDPTNSNAAYEAGEICRKAGQLERARELFETALKYNADFEEAQTGLGRVLVVMGKPDAALVCLRQAVTLNPEDDVAYYQLALAYKAVGKTDEQRSALSKFQQLQAQRAAQQNAITQSSYPQSVTKQQLDPEPSR